MHLFDFIWDRPLSVMTRVRFVVVAINMGVQHGAPRARIYLRVVSRGVLSPKPAHVFLGGPKVKKWIFVTFQSHAQWHTRGARQRYRLNSNLRVTYIIHCHSLPFAGGWRVCTLCVCTTVIPWSLEGLLRSVLTPHPGKSLTYRWRRISSTSIACEPLV